MPRQFTSVRALCNSSFTSVPSIRRYIFRLTGKASSKQKPTGHTVVLTQGNCECKLRGQCVSVQRSSLATVFTVKHRTAVQRGIAKLGQVPTHTTCSSEERQAWAGTSHVTCPPPPNILGLTLMLIGCNMLQSCTVLSGTIIHAMRGMRAG
jgi:hypothetical protein